MFVGHRERVNQEADDLSNGKTEGYAPENRALQSIGEINWLVLDRLMEFGTSFERNAAMHGRRGHETAEAPRRTDFEDEPRGHCSEP